MSGRKIAAADQAYETIPDFRSHELPSRSDAPAPTPIRPTRAYTGYVDFYTTADDDLDWEVARFDERAQKYLMIVLGIKTVAERRAASASC